MVMTINLNGQLVNENRLLVAENGCQAVCHLSGQYVVKTRNEYLVNEKKKIQ